MLLCLRRDQLLARCSLRLTKVQYILLLQTRLRIYLGSSDVLTSLFFIEPRHFLNMLRSAFGSLLSDALFKALPLSDLTENERVGAI